MSTTHLVDVARWLGQGAAPLDPTTMRYRAAPAREDAGDCAGCVFRGQKFKVCEAAAAAAQRAGMPDCEDRDTETKRTFIYVSIPIDPRQAVIE